MPPTPLVVLVTGGAGYVGSHTVLTLLQDGHHVIVIDNCINCAGPEGSVTQSSNNGKNSGSSDTENTLEIEIQKSSDGADNSENKNGVDNSNGISSRDSQTSPESFKSCAQLPKSLLRVQQLCNRTPTFYLMSLLDGNSLKRLFDKHRVDVVIHFAALKCVGESVEQPLRYYHNNITATITLLEAMEDAGVRRLVFSSSATVYGVPQYLPIDERHHTGRNITNPYGQTKYMAEQIMEDLARSNTAWRVVVLRYFNPVGAHMSGLIGEDPRGPPNNLVPFIAQVAVGRRKKLLVFGGDFETRDGTGVRDYIHVMDLAEGHTATLALLMGPSFGTTTPEGTGWRAFNLGTGRGVSVMEMIEAFQKASGREVSYEVVGRRVGDCAELVACCRRAEEELNWKATRTLQDMCEDTWRWQSNNPNGYDT